jgi:glycosyltransferase involved in cell wall biosynthesis
VSTYYKQAPLGVRSIAVVYDLIAMKYPLIDRNRADAVDCRRAIAEASAVVSISEQTAADVKRFTGRESAVTYPGVDATFGHVKPSDVERFQQRIGKPYVLVVGNRGLYKNVQSLYQAWALWGAHADYKLLCVGGENSLPADGAFASRYADTWQRVVLDDAEMPLAYAGALALCYPSLMEGFGLPLVEAMACACPIICDHAMHEVVGDAGFYCRTTHPREIAAALDAALDFGMRLERITRGVARAKRYTWTGMAVGVADAVRRAAA